MDADEFRPGDRVIVRASGLPGVVVRCSCRGVFSVLVDHGGWERQYLPAELQPEPVV